MTIEFSTRREPHHTHSVEDGHDRYFFKAGTQDPQAIADAFLADYYVEPEWDDGEPVTCTIESIDGAHLAAFSGRPGSLARIISAQSPYASGGAQ